MSSFQQVTFAEFVWLLTKAQEYHITQGEPIPAINQEGKNGIEYCLQAPFMGFGEEEFHKTFDSKAAILFYDLCKLHCLLNGNKRMAVETTVLFAFKNGRYCYIDKGVLRDMAIKVVESDAQKKDDIVWWLERVFYGGIRVMTWKMKLRLYVLIIPLVASQIFKNIAYRLRLTKHSNKI